MQLETGAAAADGTHPADRDGADAGLRVWSWNRQRLSLLLVAVAGVLVLGALFPTRTTVAVPDLVGLDDDPARRVLADHDLGIVVAGFDATSDLPDGAVVRMDPPAGETILRGLAVRVIISRPPR